ncbi:Beta-ketoacyl-acyl-carrier-protein synthase I [Limosilactobacillus gastricus PS3]|uniref:Beta-ketoacyl-[acyl-carrier-protein] synthase III n=1 Tax=Limosilactobacillus gastricus PS3 TaxID=1144300 RepID=H4GIL7_9LACO|nr:beta-ketoacyl-ACP synthase III [Limosilactobacillus gastricus]EHS87212.1 Beta-ketoacyl-acyl-carrier-protein synthase I [Limosilactobacillus gastricus PS3]
MEAIKIIETARYAPSKIVTNDDLSQIMDTSDEWITERTGIRQRHISEGENTSDLAIKVGERLLAKSGYQPDQVDLIIVATMSPDAYTPATAAIVQGELGASHAVAFDISAACSGFMYAMMVAKQLLQMPTVNRAMVIGAEVLSKIIDWQDRTTAVLFGDGAGGVLLEKDATATSIVLGQNWQTFGDQHDALSAGYTKVANQFPGPVTDLKPFYMDGHGVYRFATHQVPKSIIAAADQASIDVDAIDHFILHQANARIIRSVAKRLHVSQEKFPININEYGNTSAASEPILLSECVDQGIVKRGDIIALSGFGGGLTVGTMIIKY